MMIVMALTSSASSGLAAGFGAYVCLTAIHGEAREVDPRMWAVSAAFVLYCAADYIQLRVK